MVDGQLNRVLNRFSIFRFLIASILILFSGCSFQSYIVGKSGTEESSISPTNPQPPTSPPSPGDIDIAFGTNGYVDFTGTVSDVVVLPDKSMIVIWVDQIASDFVLTKLKPNGTADSAFGVNGHARYSIASLSLITINSVKVDSLGKIVVSGMMQVGFDVDATLLRFTSTGQLDTTFNGTGQLRVLGTAANEVEWFYDFIFLNDGSILALGESADFNRGMAVKVLSNGQQDTSWGSYVTKNGIYRNTGTVGDDVKFSAAAEDLVTGKIYLAGAGKSYSSDAGRRLVVTRLNTNGTTDNTFDGDGTWLGTQLNASPTNATLAAISFQKNEFGSVTKMLGGFPQWTGMVSFPDNFYFQYNVNASNLSFDTANFASPTGYVISSIGPYMTTFCFESGANPVGLYVTIRPTIRDNKIYFATNLGWVHYDLNGTNFNHQTLTVSDPISKLIDYDSDRMLGMTSADSTRLYRFFD